LGQKELSRLAGVGISTLKRIELASEITGAAQTLWKIQTALEKAGAQFIPADDSMGPGVRMKEAYVPLSKKKARAEPKN
jgi:hypothetical protein